MAVELKGDGAVLQRGDLERPRHAANAGPGHFIGRLDVFAWRNAMLGETGILRLRAPGGSLRSFIHAAAGDAADEGERERCDINATRHAKTFARRRLSRIEAFRLTERKDRPFPRPIYLRRRSSAIRRECRHLCLQASAPGMTRCSRLWRGRISIGYVALESPAPTQRASPSSGQARSGPG